MTTTIPVGGEGFAAYEVVVGRGLLQAVSYTHLTLPTTERV